VPADSCTAAIKSYSITSSASATRLSGMVMPRALVISNSNMVGARTGSERGRKRNILFSSNRGSAVMLTVSSTTRRLSSKKTAGYGGPRQSFVKLDGYPPFPLPLGSQKSGRLSETASLIPWRAQSALPGGQYALAAPAALSAIPLNSAPTPTRRGPIAPPMGA
jgi:hypothetical protein